MIPRKTALGLDPRAVTGLRKRSCASNKPERMTISKVIPLQGADVGRSRRCQVFRRTMCWWIQKLLATETADHFISGRPIELNLVAVGISGARPKLAIGL